MSQIRLIIADKDSMFLEKLSAYLQKSRTVRFSIELFTSAVKLEEWLKKEEEADLVLISSALLSEITKKPVSKNTAILSDSDGSMIPEGYNSIYKYTPAENLMKEIIWHCAENLPGRIQKKDYSSKVHLVLYADGSDAFNPFAQAMAEIYAKNKQTVFYLNLDELSDTDSWYSGNSEKGLSEMLYYVKAQKDNLSLRAEACTSKDFSTGLDFMKSHKNAEDIGKLNLEECQNLIGAIRGRNCYNHIIISRALRYDSLLSLLLGEADTVYLSASDYKSSISRLSQAAKFLTSRDNENNLNINDKLLICINEFFKKGQSGQILDFSSNQTFYLPLPAYENEISQFRSGEYDAALEEVLQKGSR